MKTKNKIYLFLNILVVLCLCVLIPAAGAAEFRIAKQEGNIVVAKDDNPRNLYSAGNMISVDGNVTKDMIAAGNILNVNGDIGDDLWMAGGTVVVQGNIGGSLRLAGGNIMINGIVKEDILVAGGNVTISNLAKIGGDIYVAGGVINIDALVDGDINIVGGRAMINNKVGGDVYAKMDDVLELGSGAVIDGNLTYKAPKDLIMKEGAQINGEAEFSRIASKKWAKKDFGKILIGFLTIKFLIKILSLVVTGLVLVHIFSKTTSRVVKKSLKNFWPSLGIGFAALVLTPVVCIILLVTVIGAKLAMILGVIYALVIMLSVFLGSIALGSLLMKLITKKDKYIVDWQAVVVGAVVFAVLRLIPIIGWLTYLVFALIALGVLYKTIYEKMVELKPFKIKAK